MIPGCRSWERPCCQKVAVYKSVSHLTLYIKPGCTQKHLPLTLCPFRAKKRSRETPVWGLNTPHAHSMFDSGSGLGMWSSCCQWPYDPRPLPPLFHTPQSCTLGQLESSSGSGWLLSVPWQTDEMSRVYSFYLVSNDSSPCDPQLRISGRPCERDSTLFKF